MQRRAIPAAAIVAGLLAASGCGGGSKPYTAKGTAPCLRTKGFTKVTTNPRKIPFIAAFAENGGLQATSRAGNAVNVLTIAFAADEASAASTRQAFRRHAPRALRPHLNDVMSSQRNAVLVWTVTPDPGQLADADACLHP